MANEAKLSELEELRFRVSALEAEIAGTPAGPGDWRPAGYYTTYHVLAGMVLGFLAATVSLLFNVVGAAMVGKHPLELIRVYLTFPMGESALGLESGFALAAGCCLYLGTGMLGGVPFHLILSRYFADSAFGVRFAVASLLGIGVWLVNFYGMLSWLQPMVVGGNWIVEKVPLYVAAGTHLVFGWTMMLVEQWGRFTPRPTQTTEAAGA